MNWPLAIATVAFLSGIAVLVFWPLYSARRHAFTAEEKQFPNRIGDGHGR